MTPSDNRTAGPGAKEPERWPRAYLAQLPLMGRMDFVQPGCALSLALNAEGRLWKKGAADSDKRAVPLKR